ncbi:MAG: hypothetical protein ACUVR3_03740 [Candidatus Roseilinea sp.]|uniref:hypothetical protein n=1 Tax=Candidatus Roseilinea sp. TaxID=2838777 RepID=UPI00404AB96D
MNSYLYGYRLKQSWPRKAPTRRTRYGYLLGPVGTGSQYFVSGIATRLGVPARLQVMLYERLGGRFVNATWSDPTTGAYKIPVANPNMTYFVVALDKSPTPIAATVVDFVTGRRDGEPPWHLPMLNGRVVSGIARSTSGEPAELVSIRDWAAKKVVANIQPAQDGSWSVTLPSGEYDITYYKRGCAPVCHGPYTILPE